MAYIDQIGNSIPAPGYKTGPTYVDDELLFSTVGFTQKGVTLKPGQGVLLLGTLIKQDPSSKMYIKATDSTAEGLLRQTTDTGADSSAQVYQQNIVIAGIAKLSKVSSANSGVTISSITWGRVNSVIGTFKF